uniref:Uncharacterized protein n=1 Tax=Ciona savignyi TaxID=51511 RepID=H2ZE40_CIOSA
MTHMDSSFGNPRASSSLSRSYEHSLPRKSMLSDRAKLIRSEASRKIDALLADWRDYKERAEEEIRRRSRMEQYLREMMTRKEREAEELSFELSTIAKLNRYTTQLLGEIQARDDVIKAGEAERANLQHLNTELRHRNIEQHNKIEICEHDVTETRMELEILEDMVKALNDRKSSAFSTTAASPRHTPRPQVDLTTPIPRTPPRTQQNNRETSTYPKKAEDDANEYSFNTTVLDGYGQISKPEAISASKYTSTTSSSEQINPRHDAPNTSRGAESKKSALSALKSLQNEHAQKCSSLADHIKKLKEENALKEKKISDLQRKQHKKTGPME